MIVRAREGGFQQKKGMGDLERVYSEVMDRRLYFGGFPSREHWEMWIRRVAGWGGTRITMVDLTTPLEKEEHALEVPARAVPIAELDQHRPEGRGRALQDDDVEGGLPRERAAVRGGEGQEGGGGCSHTLKGVQKGCRYGGGGIRKGESGPILPLLLLVIFKN
jgi:hypothetical protein